MKLKMTPEALTFLDLATQNKLTWKLTFETQMLAHLIIWHCYWGQ